MIKRARFISGEEVNLLRYSLGISNAPRIIKLALQSLCVHYESGRILKDTSEIRQLIHSHLGSIHVLLRRWSLKALGLIRDPDDAPRIADRLRIESDQEALTWGTAAILGSSPTQDIREIIRKSHLNSDIPLLLAARLYASESWLKKNNKAVTVSLNDDELTLKWAIFLIGYKKASRELFSAKFENDTFLAELNQHHSPEIAEYSVWALHERSDFDYTHGRIPIDGIAERPPNVRKWLYRLLLKGQSGIMLDVDAFTELSFDKSASAREGLAQAVAGLLGRQYDDALLSWFIREKDAAVKETILESVARRGEVSLEFAQLIQSQFESAAPDSRIRKRLIAATENTPLFLALKKRDALDTIVREGLAQYAFGFSATTNGGIIVNNNSINVQGDLNAQNVSAGDMIGSANGAVQNIQANRVNDKETLTEILGFLEKISISESHKTIVAEKVKLVAETPSLENKKGLLSSIKTIGEALAVTGGSIEGVNSMIELAKSLMS